MFNSKVSLSKIISDIYNNPDKYNVKITLTEIATTSIDNYYKNICIFLDEDNTIDK